MTIEDKEKIIPDIPPQVPTRGNWLTRGLGKSLLRMLGWRVTGDIPPLKKCLLAAAPHTSNWDFVVAMPAALALGLRVSFMMKKEAFFWPCAGLFKFLGGIPTDRSAAEGVVNQVVDSYARHQALWIGITPEGTRSKVEHWKTGFLRIAHQAGVPVLLMGWNYPTRTIHLGKLFHPTGDVEQDISRIRAYYRETFSGRNPELE